MSRLAFIFAASVLACACGWFDPPVPETARVLVEGEAGKQVRLVTSSGFVSAVNDLGQTTVVLFTADTVITTLPYERNFRIDEDQRFFAEASRLDSDVQTVHVQIYLDERKQFDEGGPLLEGKPYRFVYTFNQTVTREIVVL